MKSFPQDTNASAVILCDFGVSQVGDELNVEFTRHLRVKILTTKGFEWGTFSIRVYEKGSEERITDIKAATYNLDENGKIEKIEMPKKDVFKEKVANGRVDYKFTLPGLKVGSVIEVSYKIDANNLFQIKDWTFQHEEPVLWSEYRVISPLTISYSAIRKGYEDYFVQETYEDSKVFSGTTANYMQRKIIPCTFNRWVVKDAPAIREEAFMTTTDDYVNKVELQLAGYSFPGVPWKNVLNTWSSFSKELMDSKNFSRKIDDTRKVKKQVEIITKDLVDPEQKLFAIYDWVSRSITWNKASRIFADLDVNEVLEKKEANSAEITFLLLSMLKCAGIEGEPVILSTRGNGKLQTLYPIVSQFNYVMARVKIGEKIYNIDATDPLRPIDILPKKVLNIKGLVIKKNEVEWVDFTSDKQHTVRSISNIYLNEDGSLSGNLTDQYS